MVGWAVAEPVASERSYDHRPRTLFFETWNEFTAFKRQLNDSSSPVAQFERAVDAIVAGDAETLRHLLTRNPDLIRAAQFARTTRCCCITSARMASRAGG